MPLNSVGASGLTVSTRRRVSEGSRAGLRFLAPKVLDAAAITDELLRELPDNAWFDVAMMQKDLRLALDHGRDEGVPMPSTTVADQMLSTAREAGYEHRDIAVVFRMLSEMVTVPSGRPLGTVAA